LTSLMRKRILSMGRMISAGGEFVLCRAGGVIWKISIYVKM
jgi:hypothetical protein